MGEALRWTVGYLERRGVENPRRSAEWLLSASMHLSRVELYARFDRELTAEERVTLRSGLERRAAGEPLQYVTGEMPFRHLVLQVRPGVFIPRPETEVLVDTVLEYLDRRVVPEPIVVDLCTGSCAIAASIAHERPLVHVFATELVAETAAVARDNAERSRAGDRIRVLVGDLFAPLPRDLLGRVDVVVSNPPYVPTADLACLPAEVASFEPMVALHGGPDGLAVVRRIADEAHRWLRPGGLLAVETDTLRTKQAARLLAQWYEGIEVRQDLTGRDRIAMGLRREA